MSGMKSWGSSTITANGPPPPPPGPPWGLMGLEVGAGSGDPRTALGPLLVVSGVVGARRMLVGKLGAPIAEPGALATGVPALEVLEAFAAPLVAPPALKPGA